MKWGGEVGTMERWNDGLYNFYIYKGKIFLYTIYYNYENVSFHRSIVPHKGKDNRELLPIGNDEPGTSAG